MAFDSTASEEESAFLEEIVDLVSDYFIVGEYWYERGVLTLRVYETEEGTKEPFLRLYKKLVRRGLLPFLRKKEGSLIMKVVPFEPKKHSRTTSLLLLVLTIATTMLTGYLMVNPSLGLLVNPVLGDPLNAVYYALAILLIVGVHEMGHKIASDFHGIRSSLPYFIPGIPPIGTFGAVIMQETPAVNRDQLFDLGISGPLFGFLMTIPIALIGFKLSPLVPFQVYIYLLDFNYISSGGFLNMPPLLDYIIELTAAEGVGGVIFLHPIAFAAWLGCIITMLNVFPAGHLDGGHVVRAVLGEKAHHILSILSVVFLLLLGYWPMALLVLIMVMRMKHPGPLDDVSELSLKRKIFAVTLPILLFLTFTPTPFA